MRPPPAPAPSRAFLLHGRLGRGPGRDIPGVWRFSLEDPDTGARGGFPSLAALVALLAAVQADGRRGLGGRGDGPHTEPAAPAREGGPSGTPDG